MKKFLRNNINVIIGIICIAYVLISVFLFNEYENVSRMTLKTFLYVLIAFSSGMNIGVSICGKGDTSDVQEKN